MKRKLKLRFKSFLSVMLTVAMLFGMMPATLDAETASAAQGTTRIYLDTSAYGNGSGWSNAYVYLWDKDNTSTNYHGRMTAVEGKSGVFYFDVPETYTNVIFKPNMGNNWDGQTADSDSQITTQNNLFTCTGFGNKTSGTWGVYTETPDPGPSTGEAYKVTFNTNNMKTKWSNLYVYCFKGLDVNTGSLSNTGKTVVTGPINGVYTVTIEDGSQYDKIIFSDKNNWTDAESGYHRTVNLDLVNGKAYIAERTPAGSYNGKPAYTCGAVSEVVEGAFPSSVTGRATFYDLYTDYEINNNKNTGSTINIAGNNMYWNSMARGRAFMGYVNQAISSYAQKNSMQYPMYFGNFQPGYLLNGGNSGSYTLNDATKWFMTVDYNDVAVSAENRGYNNSIQGLYNFYWLINRSVDTNTYNVSTDLWWSDQWFSANVRGDSAGYGYNGYTQSGNTGGDYGAVTQGLVNNTLVNGNIVDKSGKILPQFNKTFYETQYNGKTIGKVYDTVDFPFRETTSSDGAKLYVFDSNEDVVRMSDSEDYLKYYHNEKQVQGMKSDGSKSTGFFPFNDPEDGVNEINYGYTMKLEVDFTITEDGMVNKVDGSGKVPAKFKFSGDDDVWVYIDGVLALDLGGDHGKAVGELNFNTLKATVQSAKHLELNAESTYGNKPWVNITAGGNTSGVTSSFTIDRTVKEHTLTIFYTERGMFESNFKAEFQLDMPTNLIVTNKVELGGINAGLQDAMKAIVDSEEFSYAMKENGAATDKTFITEDGNTAYTQGGKVIIKNNGKIEYNDKFIIDSHLGITQDQNSKYDTSWILKEDTSDKEIASSFEDSKNNFNVEDDTDPAGFWFVGLNTDGNQDKNVAPKLEADFVQYPKTGNIAIKKVLTADALTGGSFTFEVSLANLFGSGSAQKTYDLVYDLYRTNGTVVENQTAANGRITLLENETAIIKNIPVETGYTVKEVFEGDNGEKYSVYGVVKSDGEGTSDEYAVSTEYVVSGTIKEDSSVSYDLYTYTNDAKTPTDSFMVEKGKENTLMIIPSENSGELTGELKTIKEQWELIESKAEAGDKVTIKFVDDSGNLVDELPGVSLVTPADGSVPYVKYTPDVDTEEEEVDFFYKIVLVDLQGNIKTEEVADPSGSVVDTPIQSGKIKVENYLFKASDDYYVLDYGINVELSKESESDNNGLFGNDELYNTKLTSAVSEYWNTATAKSTSAVTAPLTMVKNTSMVETNYGKYQPAAGSNAYTIGYTADQKLSTYPTVEYSLKKFLDREDNYSYNVMVKRNDGVTVDSSITNRNAVNVTSNVTVIPASIVYYEDNFNVGSSIGYAGGTQNVISGTSINGGQSNKLTGEYGNDSYYDEQYGDSAGTSRMMTTEGYSNIAKTSFTFTGTGFDIVGRTSPTSPMLLVKAVGANGTTKQQLVDTYYQQGTLYHVPVVHFDMETYQEYTVTVEVLPGGSISGNGRRTTFYLDGIRVYNPLSAQSSDVAQYNTDEKGVDIREIRTDIVNKPGKIALVKPNADADNFRDAIANAGYTVIENYGQDENGNKYEVNSSSSPDNTDESLTTYINAGPNNETYMGAGYGFAFKVESNGDAYLQFEAKNLTKAPVTLKVKNYTDSTKDQTITVNSSVSRYYKVDLTKCESTVVNGKTVYNVVIYVEGTENTTPTPLVSFTNMKLTSTVELKAVQYATGDDSVDIEFVDSQNGEAESTQSNMQKSKYAEFSVDDNGNTYIKKLNFEVSVF